MLNDLNTSILYNPKNAKPLPKIDETFFYPCKAARLSFMEAKFGWRPAFSKTSA